MTAWSLFSSFWRRIGSEASWLAIGQGLSALGGLVAIRLLTGYFPNQVYGLAWLFINGVGLAVLLFSNPLGQSLNRFYHDDGGQAQLDRLLGLVWRLELYFALASTIIYYVISVFLGYLSGSRWLTFAIMPVYFLFSSHIYITQHLLNTSRQRFGRVVLIAADAWLKPLLAILLCIYWKPTLEAFVLGYTISAILTGSAGMWWMSKYGSALPFRLPIPQKKYIYKVLSYGLPWLGLACCSWLLTVSDRYLVNYFLGAAFTGSYIAAYQVGSALFQFVGGSFGPLVQPIIFKKIGKTADSSSVALSAAFIAFIWISVPVLGFFIVTHVWLMHWLIARSYWNNDEVVFWVGLGTYLWIFGDLAMNAFLITKRSFSILVINASAAVLNIVLNIILIPKLGLIGAALSTFYAYSFYALNMIYWGKKLLPWKFPVRSLLLVSSITAIAAVFSKIIHHTLYEASYDLAAAIGVSACFAFVLLLCIYGLKSYVYLDLKNARVI